MSEGEREHYAITRLVGCPVCTAKAGEDCVGENGLRMFGRGHFARSERRYEFGLAEQQRVPEEVTAWIIDRAAQLADELESLLAEAMTRQEYGMLDHLVVIEQRGYPPTVGSLLEIADHG